MAAELVFIQVCHLCGDPVAKVDVDESWHAAASWCRLAQRDHERTAHSDKEI